MNRLIILLFLLSTFIVSAQNDKVPFLVKPLTGIQLANIQTASGYLCVEGNAGQPRLEVYVIPNSSKKRNTHSNEDLKRIVNEKYDLNISTDNNILTALARLKKGEHNSDVSISFRLLTGNSIDTRLNTSGGSITIKDISGKQFLETSGGSLHVNNVLGDVDGRTSGGSMHLNNSNGKILLNTSGGSIHAKRNEGTISLITSGGSIELDDLKGSIDVKTSGGSITGNNINGDLSAFTSVGSVTLTKLSGSLNSGTSGGSMSVSFLDVTGKIKLKTSSGNINLVVPSSKGYNIDLRAGKIETKGLRNTDGNFGEKHVVAKVNGGGFSVDAEAKSGRIIFKVNNPGIL